MPPFYYKPPEERLRELGVPQRRAEVVTRYVNGWQVKEIADDLNIAVPTVKNHIVLAHEQLGARNAVQCLHVILGNEATE